MTHRPENGSSDKGAPIFVLRQVLPGERELRGEGAETDGRLGAILDQGLAPLSLGVGPDEFAGHFATRIGPPPRHIHEAGKPGGPQEAGSLCFASGFLLDRVVACRAEGSGPDGDEARAVGDTLENITLDPVGENIDADIPEDKDVVFLLHEDRQPLHAFHTRPGCLLFPADHGIPGIRVNDFGLQIESLHQLDNTAGVGGRLSADVEKEQRPHRPARKRLGPLHVRSCEIRGQVEREIRSG